LFGLLKQEFFTQNHKTLLAIIIQEKSTRRNSKLQISDDSSQREKEENNLKAQIIPSTNQNGGRGKKVSF